MTSTLRAGTLALFLVSVGLAGCPNDSGIGVATLGISTLIGTVAKGNPIGNATLTLEDRNGVARSVFTTADGRYTLDIAGLTPPFLIRVDDPTGVALYSVAQSEGVANVTPLTSLVATSYYDAQGLSLTSQFDAASPAVVPTAAEVLSISTVIRRAVGSFLAAQGVDTSTFDLITTPFSATSTSGVDPVLDLTTVSGGTIQITDAAGTALTTTVTASGGTLTFDTAISSTAGASTQFASPVIVPPAVQADLTAADAGIRALIAALSAIVKAKGAALTGADLLPFLDDNYLDKGENRVQYSDRFADEVKGVDIEFIGIDQILRFDRSTANHVLDAITKQKGTRGGIEVINRSDQDAGFQVRKQDDGTWRFFGDQRIAHVKAFTSSRTEYPRDNGPTNRQTDFSLEVQGAPGTLSGVTATGLIPPDLTNRQTVTIPRDQSSGGRDIFRLRIATGAFPTAGTPYEFSVVPSPTAAPALYTLRLTGASSEQFEITHYTVQDATTGAILIPREARASFKAKNVLETPGYATADLLGKRLIVEWTLPRVTINPSPNPLEINVSSGSGGEDVSADTSIPMTGTLSQIVVPAVVPGTTDPVKEVSVGLRYYGEDGAELVTQESLKQIP